MKKIVRLNTFETNSSSSHSLVITTRTEPVMKYFPKNSDEVFKLTEYGVVGRCDYGVNVETLYCEVDKARFMLNILATHIDDDTDYYEEGHYPEVTYWADSENNIKNENRTFETFIKQKPFVWLKELLEEKTGTKFEFAKPNSWRFPYYETIYLEEDLDEVVDIDWFDEKLFKERVSKIIFNDDIIIKDIEESY